jgi:hypothetical protein
MGGRHDDVVGFVLALLSECEPARSRVRKPQPRPDPKGGPQPVVIHVHQAGDRPVQIIIGERPPGAGGK